ncbi:Rhomboid family protein [Nocardioides dokdonensis FR1436]|uniref:Rhomboid family protein n=1 Tax=Nocardioides dokdonensis FR1436 TaxID=1300347 RepID=A0A1A9GL94_9ACTN|nr:rhomboid family intramembrane serine protease [Nocardioides dokdonensis]ANH38215.1 Rhomboid family protein [Nocardioides dokdonensis FR1436]
MSDTRTTGLGTWVPAAVLSVGFVVLLWLIEIADQLTPSGSLDDNGVRPRTDEGLLGILIAPVLHGGWDHLVGNSGPVLVLLFAVLVGNLARGLTVTAVVWVASGFGTWLVAGSQTSHIGASGLVFGWLVYLVLRGFFARSALQIGVGVVLFLVYGSILWGVLPGQPGISWQGHLFGAVGGVVAAWLTARSRVARRG